MSNEISLLSHIRNTKTMCLRILGKIQRGKFLNEKEDKFLIKQKFIQKKYFDTDYE